ncbi:hypothetical protein [Faecalispora anaeroviscerum]|uniref:hypothetical protein n=1 Tax=Faecalispora anaeroviscerum TaxID=2991836 RepID=UPI0024B8DD98|nr:hypothetical protein [Faecalispora anaeroviscerum]
MNHFEMLNRAELAVSSRATQIKYSVEPGDIDCTYYEALGYISSLYDMGVFNASQHTAALAVFDAALYEAEDERAKKVAPSAANTESDKAKSLNSSLEQKPEGVKPRPDAFVHADIYSETDLHMEISGETRKLLAILSCYISSLRGSGVPENEIQAAICLSHTVPKEGKTNA